MIESNTLYYTFSTISQVSVALIAIIIVFVHFRINRSQDYLIGDGLSVLKRYKNEQMKLKEYKIKENELIYNMSDLYADRLRDGIYRKNIYEIIKVLELLSKKEKDEGFTKIDRPKGFQYLYEHQFCITMKKIKELKNYTKIDASLVILTIITSIVCLSLVDEIKQYFNLPIILIVINIILIILSLIFSLVIVFNGLDDNDPHEND